MVSTQSKSALSLLLVEDDLVTLKMLGIVIHSKFPDLAIYYAENGRMGVDLFKEHFSEIVATDINMPVMDGIEMAGEIKSIRADTRFIVMTAHSNSVYVEKFSEIGFSEYLLKPIEFKKLFAAIERTIAELTMERQ